MVSTRRKKAVVSTEFIEGSDESDGNDTYQEDECVSLHFFIYSFLTNLYSSSSDDCDGENDDIDNEEEEKEAMSVTFISHFLLIGLHLL